MALLDKSRLLRLVLEQLRREMEVQVRGAEAARGEATHAETKQEGKYDTRSIEASYLAHGQSLRAAELQNHLDKLAQFDLPHLSETDECVPGALVEVEKEKARLWVFVLPYVGGLTVKMDAREIQVVSTLSPLGRELIGKAAGDDLTVQGRQYEVLSVA